MKKIQYIWIGLVAMLSSCADYLDIAPDNIATIEYAFRDKVSAEKFLTTCYADLPQMGNPARDVTLLGSDDVWCYEDSRYYDGLANYYPHFIKLGRQTANNPYLNFWDGLNWGARSLWQGIRNCNIFMENVDHVGVQLQGAEKDRWTAEVKFLKAYYHYYLLRMYGPIPLMKENQPVEASPEEVRTYRDPFDECVDYIVQLIDEAVPYLPLTIEIRATEMGRITKPIALAIKAEMLMMAASPLFNGNPDFMQSEDNRGVKLFPQEYDPNKWVRAATACKNAIDTCHLGEHRLYTFDNRLYETSDTTRLINTLRCVASERYNEEMIWGLVRRTVDNWQRYTMPFFLITYHNTNPWEGVIAPTIRAAELYYSNNGVPIEEDTEYDYNNRFEVAEAPESHYYYIQSNFRTAKLNMNREPRFYANLTFDGAYWFGNGRYRDVGMGSATETAWPMNMKQGEASGKVSSLRYSITGYWAKKPSHIQTTTNTNGGGVYTDYRFPIIRLADLYLLYAEALNEINNAPTAEVYEYIDMVRERAGLEGVRKSWTEHSKYPGKVETQSGMREIIHRERMIELSFEGKRFWDIRRWKRASEIIPGPVQGWNIEADNEGEYYQVVTLDNLKFAMRDYLWPIRTQSIRVNTNLVQNPYWN